MTAHTFTLIVEGPDLQDGTLIEALFAAGCDDALVGRAEGVQYVNFDRDADTLQDAILSAVADLETVAGVNVVRLADAGLISMSDIAVRTGRTRESVRLLIAGERGPGSFPPPATDPRSRYRLWRTAEVDSWFQRHLATPLEGARDDQIRATINAGLELRQHRRQLTQDSSRADLRALVGL